MKKLIRDILKVLDEEQKTIVGLTYGWLITSIILFAVWEMIRLW